MSTIEKKSLNVGKYVKTVQVDEIIRTYKKERWVHNSARLGKEDSLSTWYSIEELEEFISNSKAHGADGIKLYFAAYPENNAPKPEYAGLQTIVLVATKSKETSAGIINKDVFVTRHESLEILAYNAGRLCPPFCGGGGGGTDADNEWGMVGLTLLDKGREGLVVI